MKELIAELEQRLDRVGSEGYGNENGFLTNDRDWHATRELVARLKQRAALLDANPDMSHGLKAPPSSARIAN